MYKRLSAVLFPIVAVLLAGTAIWGYQENQEKNSILIKAENQYQRAFHNLSSHIEQLHSELGNALAVNSTSQNFHRKCLVNAWRITSEAQNEINQLPLTLMPFHKTEKFLASMANFTYHVAIRDMSKEPISEKEMATLKTLYKRSKEISKEIRNVQTKVLNENLRWMDVEIAMAGENEPMDNGIIDGFKLVNKRISEYDEVDFGPATPDIFQTRSFKQLSGKMLTPEEIKKKAAEFFESNGQEMKIVENGSGTEYASYTVTMEKEGRDLHADFTKRGGQLVWFMDNRPVNSKNLSVEQARAFAQRFLKKHGFGDMTAVSYDEYQNVAALTMARKIGKVTVYPEKLSIKVALDNGDVTGMQEIDMLYAKKDRKIPEPKLSQNEAKKKLNPNFKIANSGLAIIENDLRKEVLCYEFVGEINGNEYRIFINADTGYEEEVQQIRDESVEEATI